ncbi:hypothetical protein [Oscillatoria acuminata]|nr:hypothetical protein [Oscillatoria acuminata]
MERVEARRSLLNPAQKSSWGQHPPKGVASPTGLEQSPEAVCAAHGFCR